MEKEIVFKLLISFFCIFVVERLSEVNTRVNRYNYYLYNKVIYYLIVIIMCLFTSCANIVTPRGGPKDIQSPVLLESEPSNYSANFKEKEIRIYFDEFIKLNNLNKQFIISPPIKNFPDFSIRGKSVVIEFSEELKENTTYTLYFGDAIVDITENNPVTDYQYVFSTGNVVDSLTVAGKIVDAFTIQPVEDNITVMLYADNYDSIPYKEIPSYLIIPNKSGEFRIKNIKGGAYKIFALKDANSNYIYDLPNEMIAFHENLITPEYIPRPVIDTAKADSSHADSLKTIHAKEENIQPKTIYNLYLFQEIDTSQKLLNTSSEVGILKFIFKQPVKKVSVKPLNCQFDYNWKIEEFNLTRDSMFCWLLNVNKDSLILEIADNGIILDTVELKVEKEGDKKEKRSKKNTDEPEKLPVQLSVKDNTYFDFYKSVYVVCSNPLKEYDFSKILITELGDTSVLDTIIPQVTLSDNIRRMEIKYQWKEAKKYNIFIPPATFKDILGKVNDTINAKFTTKGLEYYGTVKLNVTIPEKGIPYIVQLLNEKEKVLKENTIKKSETITYQYLEPVKYKVKIIYDSNKNGKWDTGNYLRNIQPEMVKYCPETITAKSNWDVDVDWNVE